MKCKFYKKIWFKVINFRGNVEEYEELRNLDEF